MSEPTRRSTRSGRRVTQPTRYEPDPNVVLEDDYSDCESECYASSEDEFTGSGNEDDEEFVSDIAETDSEDEEEDSDMSECEADESEDDDESVDDEEDDILDFECLTDNATDGSLSSDEEDM